MVADCLAGFHTSIDFVAVKRVFGDAYFIVSYGILHHS